MVGRQVFIRGEDLEVEVEESGTAASASYDRGNVEELADEASGMACGVDAGLDVGRLDESNGRSDVDMAVEGGGVAAFGVSSDAPVSFTAASRLQFQSVASAEGGEGTVEVAIALSMNSSYTGVLEVPARTDTGSQRCLKGDEFFFVKAGSVMLELGDARYHLHTGDHVAIPHMACYSFHNNTSTRCSLVFFVPRNPFG